jgi:cytochrome c oxidase assembly protein subunit 11
LTGPSDPAALRKRKAKVALSVIAAVFVMLGLSFAAAPLYKTFCKLTGWGGETQVAKAAAREILDRTVEVRFDANTGSGAPFEFKPDQTALKLRVGETGLAFYRLKNLSDRPISAVATYNVTPHKAGYYFQKLQCFCFAPRTYAPGEEAELPVLFYVDPEIAKDRDADDVTSITLSYTYFGEVGQNVAGGKAKQAR